MTTLFTEDFEGDLSQWKMRGTPSLQSTIVYRGLKALMSKPYDQLFKQFASLKKVYIEGKFYYDGTLLGDPTSQIQPIRIQAAAFGDIVYIGIYKGAGADTTTVMVWSPLGNIRFISLNIPPNTWIKVGLEYISAVNGGWRAFINNDEIATVTGVDTSSKPVEYVFAGVSTTTGVNVYTDDVAIRDAYEETLTHTLRYLSTPLSVPANINGQQVSSGQSIEFNVGTQVQISVPEEFDTTLYPDLKPGTLSNLYCSPIPYGSPEIWFNWNSYWINKLDEWAKKGLRQARLFFMFPENLPDTGTCIMDLTKLDRVLEIFGSRGIQVLLKNLTTKPKGDYFAANPAFMTRWTEIATQCKGDNRISAFNIMQEPYGTNSGNSLGNVHNLQLKFKEVCEAIHAIDPTRKILYPTGALLPYANMTAWANDIKSIGIHNLDYLYFDCHHPYFWESSWDMGMTPEQKAAWYGYNYVKPLIDAGFSADKLTMEDLWAWSGLTQMPPGETPHEADRTLQLRWLTAIINECVKWKIAFSVACWRDGEFVSLQEAGLTASNYNFTVR